MHQFELQWHGPFKWYGTADDSFFTRTEALKSGIYLWTVPFKEKYLPYLVGETGRSFAQRIMEHTQEYLQGMYRVYEPDEFDEGKKILVWDGMWKKKYNKPQRMREFLNQYLKLAPVIHRFLGKFRIFVAPLETEQRIRQRIEGAITDRLLQQPGTIREFHDDAIRYRRRSAEEEPISVIMKGFESILGLDRELQA